jgi:hypothetical protein
MLPDHALREGETHRPRLELINESKYEGLQNLAQLPRNREIRSSTS